VSPAIVRATIRAEVKRARRDRRKIDRRFLYAETGWPTWDQLERLIHQVTTEILAGEVPPGIRREGGGEGSVCANSRPSSPLVKRWRKRA
jgi:hypothetical protein